MTQQADWKPRHISALVLGNIMLALGPWWVRVADSGPVSAGFWRLALAVPVLFLLATASGQRLGGFPRQIWLVMALAGVFFAADLASWHIGIGQTRLGNAALFGNSGSLIMMAWGLIAAAHAPRWREVAALIAALAGAVILMGRSFEIDARTLVGDLFCLLAGFFYAFYLLLLKNGRVNLGSWTLLAWSSLAGAPVLLVIAAALGEPVWPHSWWPLLALALGSQLVGQGLLVYALKHFSPLVIGLALLTQPAVAVLAGWLAFGEALGWLDGLGMALVSGALVLVRAREN